MTTFKRFLTLSLMTVLTAFSVQVWGTEATLNSVSTKDVATTVGASVSLEFDGVTCTCTRHSTNQPGFYTSSGIVRYYSTDVMTLSVASGNTITQIDFVMTSGTVGTASPGTLTGNQWKGSAESVSFTGGGTVKISSITVTYSSGGGSTYTVTLDKNGNTSDITGCSGTYTLPTTGEHVANACEGWAWHCWANAAYSTGSPTSTAPSSTVITTMSSAGTAYAVYKHTETSGGSSTSTFVAASQGWGDSENADTKNIDNVTYSFAQNTGTNPPKYYNSGTSVRFYQNNSLTISSSSTITAIEFSYSQSEFVQASVSTGTVTDGNWSGSATSVTFTNKNSTQVRVSQIVVTMGGGSTTTYTSSPDCAECMNKVTLTKGTPEHGSFSLDKADGAHNNCAAGGLVVTISGITPADGYQFKEITQTGIASGVTINQTSKTVTYAKDVAGASTINVVFEAIPTYTVTFNQGSGICTTPSLTETSAGDGVELPTASHGCVDWTFAGWAETSVGTETTVKPTLYAAGSTYHPTSNRNLYAVYKRTEGGGSGLEQTFNFESIAGAEDWNNGTAYTSVAIGDVTLTANGGGNNGKYYTSDKTWRIYTGGSATVSVTNGEVTAVSSNPSRSFSITDGEATFTPSANTSFKSITVTYSSGTTYYHSTPYCTGLQVTPTSLNFGTKNIGTNNDLTITVTGTELTANATLSISGANAGMFSVSPTTLLKNGSNEITGSNNVTVTYHPTAEGTHSATLTITSGSFTKTVTLSGSCALVCTTPTLTFGGTSTVSKVLGSGKFTLTATSPDNTLGAAITYSSSNTDKATVDENTGEVTLVQATGSGSPVTITATLAAKNTGVACQNEVTTSYTLTIYNKVTWLVGEDEYTGGSPTTQTTQGAQITSFPTDPNGDALCGGKVFIGWTDHEIADPVDASPTPMYKVLSDLSSVYINANKTFYAVFAAASSGAGSGNYLLVEADPGETNWAGDYLIAYDATTFADGRLGGETGMGAQYASVSPGDNLSGKVVTSSWGDTYNVTITKKTGSTNTYLLQTKDGKYNYQTSNNNGLASTATKSTAEGYPLTITFYSASDIEITVPAGPVFHYNPADYFRFYKNGGQENVCLYKKDGGGTTYSDYSTTCGTCLPAPTAPTVTPKSNRATITWTAVPDATGYTVTCTGGSVSVVGTTATITGLTAETSYDFTIRSQGSDPYSCFPAYHGSFTTTSCEDSPVLGTVAVTPTTAAISWTCEAATATVRVYEDAECNTQVGGDYTLCTSPFTVTSLTSNTTYYFKVWAGGTCPSPVGSFTTEEIKLDIAEWQTDAVVVSFNGDADLTLTTFTEETHGDPHANVADDIFFSKYFEAAASVKLLAIFNGTMNSVDLSNYELGLAQSGTSGTTSFAYKKFSEFVKSSGGGLTADELQLKSNEELIIITYTSAETDQAIIKCAKDDEENSKFSTYIRVSTPNLQFNGDDVICLKNPDGDLIDLIGAGTKEGGSNRSGASFETTSSSGSYHDFMDNPGGWYTTHGYKANADNTETADYALSSNRCLLIRRKHVKSGYNAVLHNQTDFLTLGDYTYMGDDYEGEWKGVQIPGSTTEGSKPGLSNSCDGFAVVGGYNYNDYYVDFEEVGSATTFDDLRSDPFDGTYEIPVSGLSDKACTLVRIELKDGSDNLVIRKDVKVPIMISGNKNTTDDIFHSNYKDADICRSCDVVVLDGGILTKEADGTTGDINEVRDLKIYQGGKLIIPSGTNYTVNTLAFRRQEDEVSSADIRGGLTIKKTDGVYLDIRIDPTNWHFFSLPYDCKVSDITFSTGEPATIGTDFYIQWYDGAYRAAHRTGGWTDVPADATLKKGLGYVVALPGFDIIKKELRFPMAKEVITDESTNKTVTGLYGYGADDANLRPNHKGWNLLGNPYFMEYSSDIENPLRTGLLLEDHSTDPWDGQWTEDGSATRYIVVPNNHGWGDDYLQVTIEDYPMKPFTSYFVQIGAESPLTPSDAQSILFDYEQTGRILAAPKRTNENDVDTKPIWFCLTLNSPNGEEDKTTLLISDKFTDGYDMMDDLVKMRNPYYQNSAISTAPVLASRNNEGEMVFNALSDSSAVNGVDLNYFAASDGEYTFAMSNKYRRDKIQSALLFDALTGQYHNLLEGNYSFNTAKGDNNTRFKLFVRVDRKKTPTGLIDPSAGADGQTPRKLLINGHVYILRGGVIYDMTGKQLLNL